jgi:hypothetical protein
MTWIGEQVGDQTLPIEQRVAQLKAMGHMGMTTIVEPSYYTLNVLTSEQKAQVREYLKASPYDMSNVLNALDAENYKYSESAAQKFWEEVAWTESYHGMGLPDYLPELYRILRP